ncbi:MAG TPA: hypothetical protein VFR81_09825 [Longimicrobium sp.]|nr:hypothetical protein [Longimicrobium sp.]
MPDDFDFDFTDTELFEAFRLIVSDEEARARTKAVRSALVPGTDWAASAELLLLLSIGTDSGHDKVERIRKVGQEARLTVELRGESEAGNPMLSDSELMARVRDAVVAEDARWQAQRDEMRRSLRDQGNNLPDEPRDMNS